MKNVVLFLFAGAALVLTSCATAPKATDDGQAGAQQAHLDDLQSQLAAKDAHLTQLQDLLDGLKQDDAQKAATITALTAQIQALKGTTDDLRKSLAALKSGATKSEADYLSQIADLNAKVAELQATVSGLEKERDTLAAQAQKAEQDLAARVTALRTEFSAEIARGDLDIKRFRDILVISVNAAVLFAANSPALRPESLPILRELADVFKKAPDRIVRVEGNTAVGFTDAETLKLYPTSWHLGAARSANVVQYLQVTCGMDPMQLVAVSLGEFRPKADNATEAGRALNRRVDFVLIARALYELDQLKSASQ